MDAGWARWILEQFEFQFDRVFPPDLDAGNLNAKYDVLVFVDGAIPAPGRGQVAEAVAARPVAPAGAAADRPRSRMSRTSFAAQMGSMTVDRTLPMLKQFVENGGTVIAIGGSATNFGRFLWLPMENHLVENGQPLPPTKYYVPGSVLRARIDISQPDRRRHAEPTPTSSSTAVRCGSSAPTPPLAA